MKDHEIRELVNQLRDIAIEYHGTQQLRERIARAVRAAMLAAAQHDTPALNSVQSVDSVADRWIPVSERMPESNGVYFGWDGKRVLEVNCFFGGFSANQFIHGEITHWMPLPAAPQEVNHG